MSWQASWWRVRIPTRTPRRCGRQGNCSCTLLLDGAQPAHLPPHMVRFRELCCRRAALPCRRSACGGWWRRCACCARAPRSATRPAPSTLRSPRCVQPADHDAQPATWINLALYLGCSGNAATCLGVAVACVHCRVLHRHPPSALPLDRWTTCRGSQQTRVCRRLPAPWTSMRSSGGSWGSCVGCSCRSWPASRRSGRTSTPSWR